MNFDYYYAIISFAAAVVVIISELIFEFFFSSTNWENIFTTYTHKHTHHTSTNFLSDLVYLCLEIFVYFFFYHTCTLNSFDCYNAHRRQIDYFWFQHIANILILSFPLLGFWIKKKSQKLLCHFPFSINFEQWQKKIK